MTLRVQPAVFLIVLVGFVATASAQNIPSQAFPSPDLSGNSPFWIRDGVSGCGAGNPFPQPGERIEWSGACENGLIAGAGTLTWYQHGRIVGRDQGVFENGILAGHGKIMSIDGSSYEGEFPGEGTLTLPDGGQIPARSVREPSGWSIEALR